MGVAPGRVRGSATSSSTIPGAGRGGCARRTACARSTGTSPCCCRTRSRPPWPPNTGEPGASSASPPTGDRGSSPRPSPCRPRGGIRSTSTFSWSSIWAQRPKSASRASPRLTPRGRSGARSARCSGTSPARETLPRRKRIGVHLGAAYGAAKLWPLERVIEFCQILARADVVAVLLGAPADRGLADAVARAAPALNLVGRDRPGLLTAVLAEMDVVVCGDTGVGHLAAAMGTPVVALFGPTDPALTAPRGPSARGAPSRCLRALLLPRLPDRPPLPARHRGVDRARPRRPGAGHESGCERRGRAPADGPAPRRQPMVDGQRRSRDSPGGGPPGARPSGRCSG